jgi:hypothetical protein
MTISKHSFSKSWRQPWLPVLVALAALLSFSSLAAAEDVTDPPNSQTAGNYTIDFVSPEPAGNHDALKDLTFRFKVTDRQGQPANNLQLNLTAIRDYSGQVKKEHNGPRTPNIGPIPLNTTGTPGEYQAVLQFGFNGHWFVQVDGPALGQAQAKFRLPVGAPEEAGAGIDLDWLLWVGVALTVLAIVAVVGRKGEVFPVPTEEMELPTQAPAILAPTETNQDDLAVSSSIKD